MMSWLSVGIGGAVGAMCRYGIALLISTNTLRFPLATLVANGVGALLIGVLYVMIFEKTMINESLRPVLMVGFLGGLTTFSTFSLESMQLIQGGKVILALSYILSSIAVCLLAVWIGMIGARLL